MLSCLFLICFRVDQGRSRRMLTETTGGPPTAITEAGQVITLPRVSPSATLGGQLFPLESWYVAGVLQMSGCICEPTR